MSAISTAQAEGAVEGHSAQEFEAQTSFEHGLQYYIWHQQGKVSDLDTPYFDLAKKHLREHAMAAGDNGVKWQSLFLLGDLLHHSAFVSNVNMIWTFILVILIFNCSWRIAVRLCIGIQCAKYTIRI